MAFRDIRKSRKWLSAEEIRILVALGVFLAALLALNVYLARILPGGEWLYQRWSGARAYLGQYLDTAGGSKFGRDMPDGEVIHFTSPIEPYASDLAKSVQQIVYGRIAFPDEYRYVLSDPFYVVLLYAPLAVVPDFNIVRALWMLVTEAALLFIVLFSFRLAEWTPPRGLFVVLMAFGLLSFFSVNAWLVASPTIVLTFLYLSILLSLRSFSDELAGGLLFLVAYQWEVSALFFLCILIFVLANRRWSVLAGFGMSLLVFLIISFMAFPGWGLPYIRATLSNLLQGAGLSLGSILMVWFPDVQFSLGTVVTVAVVGMVIIESIGAAGAPFRRVFWAACLALAATPLAGLAIFPSNFVVLVPSIILVIALVWERWLRLRLLLVPLFLNCCVDSPRCTISSNGFRVCSSVYPTAFGSAARNNSLVVVLDALVGGPFPANLGRSENSFSQMNWRHYTILFIIGLLVPLGISRFQALPGYMDADYYFAGGVQLAEGRGFSEPYIWNYLDDPESLPHPSHTYWMPLASIVSAAGMWIAGRSTYAAGQIPFILLSACVPLLTAGLAYSLSRQTRLAMVSGLLSIFSFYYAPFMPVPDNYGLYMIFGAAFLLLAPRSEKWIPVGLGALAGLLTLARSDGLLWLGLGGLTVMWKSANPAQGTRPSPASWLRQIVPAGILVLIGYFLVMGGWHIRSMNLFGAFMTPGGGRLLWLENYNQTFIYPPEALSRAGFLQAGWGAAIQDRVNAFVANFSNAFGAQGGIFLFPFILIGLWMLRRDLRTRIAVTGWLILFIVMTVIFPFAGSRGSFFHAGAAFQPYWWVAAPIGLDAVLEWARKRGQFTDAHAPLFFQGILVLLAIFMTAHLVNLRVISSGWAQDDAIYVDVEQALIEHGIAPRDVVIVRNPPGYFIVSGRPAVSLPFGDETTLLAVAAKFGARYLIIEEDGTFEAIQDLYDHPEDNPSFHYLGEVDSARLYRIEPAR